ncbi:MAG: cell division protein FtsL [Thiomicrospira sp.]|uniref:cell division protein FtsL n=1 Tax=Thiomicrospira sp. TaxID=935 RepID=UPI0019DD4FA5|nr:cell division protein FtsL [Thiomicrospira sp.]MBE0493104.1 cell division protein FtsL [Thiomicrospira sp.]
MPRSFKPFQIVKSNLVGLFAFLLLSFLAVSLVLIVLVQHEVRHLETRYYEQMQLKATLDEEWGRLTLEKYHLGSSARVERNAREKLGMSLGKPEQIIVLPPSEAN